jgi:hypothetical protein
MPCPPECNPHHPPAYAKAFSARRGPVEPKPPPGNKACVGKKFFVAHWDDCLKAPDEESKSGLQ